MRCVICKSKGPPLFEIPVDARTRTKWLEVLTCAGVTKICDRTTICKNHFDETCITTANRRYRLKKGSVPTIIKPLPVPSPRSSPVIPPKPVVHVDIIEDQRNFFHPITDPIAIKSENEDPQERIEALIMDLQEAKKEIQYYKAQVEHLEQEVASNSRLAKSVIKIQRDAEESNKKAMLIMDLIKNYDE